MDALSRRLRCVAPVFLFAILAAAPAPAQEDPRDLPWALRDHFTFPRGASEVLLSSTHGDWSIEGLVGRTSWSVTLGNGDVIDLPEFPPADVERRDSDHALGRVMQLTSELRHGSGLTVRREWYAFKGRPPFLVHTYVTNSGDEPLEIDSVRPLILEEDGLTLAPDAATYERRMRTHGGRYVYDPAAAPVYRITRETPAGRAVAIAVVPAGQSEPRMAFRVEPGKLLGEVVSDYAPGVALRPGETIEADTLWLCASDTTGEAIDQLFAWSAAALAPQPGNDAPPKAWVEAPGDGAWRDLTGSPWLGGNVRHILLPAGWEAEPGTLEGDKKRFKGDLDDLVEDAAKEGLRLGVTLDPLAIKDGEAEWSAVTTEGRRWLDPSSSAGRAAAAERLAEVVEDGASFIAIAPSSIPDAVLVHFNLSRAEADALAYELTAKAVAPLPVVPAASATLPLERDAWLAASAATAGLGVYNARPGPVRLDAAGAGEANEETLSALSLFGGPVALTGEVDEDAAAAVKAALAGPDMAAWACDLDKRAPLCWALAPSGGVPGPRSYLFFTGAERPSAYIQPNAGVWMDGFKQVPLAEFAKAHSPSRAMQVVTAGPAHGELAVLNVTPGPKLLVHGVERLQWDPKEGRAVGTLRGSGRGDGSVYVMAPHGWSFHRGEAGKERLRQEGGRAVEVPLERNARTSFDLEFRPD